MALRLSVVAQSTSRHFETRANQNVCWYSQGKHHPKGFFRWCELDFVHPQMQPKRRTTTPAVTQRAFSGPESVSPKQVSPNEHRWVSANAPEHKEAMNSGKTKSLKQRQTSAHLSLQHASYLTKTRLAGLAVTPRSLCKAFFQH